MKKLILFTLVLFFLSSGNVFANNNNFSVDKSTTGYLHILDSDVTTLVESAIFNVMALKKRYPESDYSAVISKLTDLSLKSENPTIRYKAFLALNYFKNKEWFGDYQFVNQADHDIVFDDIARKMDMRNKIKFINSK